MKVKMTASCHEAACMSRKILNVLLNESERKQYE